MNTQFEKFASVILDISIEKRLDYGIPPNFCSQIQKGACVKVPVRGKFYTGYVIEIKSSSECKKVFPISEILPDNGLISPDLFELSLWMARYYCAPLRNVFKVILPPGIRQGQKHKQQLYVMRNKTREELKEYCIGIRLKHPAQAAVLDEMLIVKKGILLSELLEKTGGSKAPVDTLAKKGYLILDIVRVDRSPLNNEEYFQTRPKKLNADQKAALDKIAGHIENHVFATHLLFGITGSGKTEVYLQAIEKALEMQKGVIMLVPEIALTAQTIERFRSRFEGKIAVLHHRLSAGERYDEWHRIRRGEAQIVIGARSALFCPVQNLGLIIIDEEHEPSYKQTEAAPCYQARDAAVMRGKLCKGVVILGSATPSLESYTNALNNKYHLSVLNSRADSAKIPKVTIVNMQEEYEKAQGYTTFSSPLLEGIKKRTALGEKVLLFLNRRGYHTTLKCLQCGHAVKCAHCDTALTFHLGENCLACHLCGFQHKPPPKECPKCHSQNPMKFRGIGTEQIQKALHAIFPEIRTIRLDADTTRHKGSHQKLLREFGTGKADVLIGTQMIAKGLHFPDVTLVGILNSDAGLHIPDFRASETTFQLITQVAGRSGRGEIPGEVIIQTSMPDNLTIQFASKQNYEAFYQSEIEVRKMFAYPPFSQMAKVSFSGANESRTRQCAEAFRLSLCKKLSTDDEIHAVIPSGHAKVKDQYRFQFIVKGPRIYAINSSLDTVFAEQQWPKEIKIKIDINPLSTFF